MQLAIAIGRVPMTHVQIDTTARPPRLMACGGNAKQLVAGIRSIVSEHAARGPFSS